MQQLNKYLFLPIFFLVLSCSSGEDPKNISGRWITAVSFEIDGRLQRTRITILLDQDGSSVFGNYSSNNGSSGKVEGVIKDRSLLLEMSQLTPCSGSFVIDASLAPDRENSRDTDLRLLNGSYVGQDCNEEIVGAIEGQRTSI